MPHCVLVVHLDSGLEVLHEQADVPDGRVGTVRELHLDHLLLPLLGSLIPAICRLIFFPSDPNRSFPSSLFSFNSFLKARTASSIFNKINNFLFNSLSRMSYLARLRVNWLRHFLNTIFRLGFLAYRLIGSVSIFTFLFRFPFRRFD